MKKIHFCIYTLLFVLFSSPFWGAQLPYTHGSENRSHPLHTPEDTIIEDVIIIKDTISITDSISQDSIKPKKDGLNAPVDYVANDSIVFTGTNWGFLYGDSKINYEKMSIQGEKISMNIDSSIVHATFGVDSIGKEFGFPIFTDNGTEYEMRNASYNFKTTKGYMRNVITQEGEGYIVADRTKKNDDNTFFMCDGKYTTCDHHDHPHFYLMLTKAKVRPGKDVITGPAYLVIEDLPLPLAIPFGFFPFSKKYSSGVIMPSYGDDMDRGFNLRNGGYYFAINEHFDLALTGEIYTKGSWGLNAKSNYKKRYRYSGGFDFAYLYTKYGDKDIANTFSEAKNMSINWQHQQDPKANMYRTLSASVNYATSTFNQNNLDSKYSMAGTQNTRSSNVTLTQSFPNSPFTLTANMGITQITKDSTISVTLPDLSINMSRIYPFKRKIAIGSEKWFEKIQFSYTGTLRNSIVTKDNLLFKSSLSKDWQNAMQHNIPVSATFNVFNYLNITPSFNYKERWYTRKITRQWDAVNRRHVAKDTINSFNRVYDFNYALSLQTKMYGFYEPVFKIGKVQKIRHVFTPTVTFGGNPDFSDPKFGFYERYKYLDANGIEQNYMYSPYSSEIFGVPGSGKQGNISFSFENNLEMKVATDNDSTKIVSLIDNLGINFSYNMMADSLKWSNINTNMRLKLSKSLTVNVAAEFDPYTYVWDENMQTGRKVDKLRIKEKGVFGRLIRTGYSISPSINQDTFKKWFGKGKKDDKNNKDDVTDNLTESLDEANLDDKLAGPRQSLFDSKEEVGEYDSDGYLRNDIKWNMTFNYSMTYGNTNEFDRKSNEFKRKFTHNLGVNGSIQPTKNWNLSFYTNYDFEQNKIAYMNCTVSRNLHCWNISASFVPLGPYTSYYVSLKVNSSLLQDLKYEQRNRRTSYDPRWE